MFVSDWIWPLFAMSVLCVSPLSFFGFTGFRNLGIQEVDKTFFTSKVAMVPVLLTLIYAVYYFSAKLHRNVGGKYFLTVLMGLVGIAYMSFWSWLFAAVVSISKHNDTSISTHS